MKYAISIIITLLTCMVVSADVCRDAKYDLRQAELDVESHEAMGDTGQNLRFWKIMAEKARLRVEQYCGKEDVRSMLRYKDVVEDVRPSDSNRIDRTTSESEEWGEKLMIAIKRDIEESKEDSSRHEATLEVAKFIGEALQENTSAFKGVPTDWLLCKRLETYYGIENDLHNAVTNFQEESPYEFHSIKYMRLQSFERLIMIASKLSDNDCELTLQ